MMAMQSGMGQGQMMPPQEPPKNTQPIDPKGTGGKIKLSAKKKEEIVGKLKQDIQRANDYYTRTIEPEIMEKYDIFYADKKFYERMFPRLSKRSKLTSTDVQDTIDGIMPSLMRTFFGSVDMVTIQDKPKMGRMGDVDRANKLQCLINYQLERASYYITAQQWFKDALITNLGLIKVDWDRQYEEVEQQEAMLPDVLQQFMAAEDIEVLEVEPTPVGEVIVTFKTKVMTKNEPRIMNISASEFRFSPEATKLEDADFVAHRKIVTLDYLRKQAKAGLYDNVDKLAERIDAPSYTALETQINDEMTNMDEPKDSGRRRVEIYECYVNINMSDDKNGELVPMIITLCGDTILRIEKNTYEQHPFFALCPKQDPHQIWPKTGFVDLVAQIQHAKTAIIRQMLYNIAQNNDSKMAVNLAALDDINDLVENAQFIRMRGNVNEALMPLPTAPIQTWTFNMLEYLDGVKENRTGITRYNQGMDSSSLNKTATGINIITQQANQRLEIIARTFAETGIKQLFKFLIKLDQLFINQNVIIRLTGQEMEIKPDDLEGDFDLVVNAGLGAGAKEQNLQNLQVLRGLMTELLQVNMVDVNGIYNASKKIIEELGMKNVNDFLRDPQVVMKEQQEAAQKPNDQPVSESMRIYYDELPWQIQQQFWQREGYEIQTEWFAEKEQQNIMRKMVDNEMQQRAEHKDGGGWGNGQNNGGRSQGTSAGNASVGAMQSPDGHLLGRSEGDRNRRD